MDDEQQPTELTRSLLETEVFRRLYDNRTVYLRGPIEGTVADTLAAQLMALDAESAADVTLYINSPGGSVTAGLSIYDTMQFVSCDVATYCIGQAASMGAVLLTAGAKNKRYALPNARIMIHQPLAGMEGTTTEILIRLKEFQRLKKMLNEILLKHTGQTLDKIEKDTDRDNFMSANEAQEYGLIDNVLTRIPMMPKAETT